MNKEELKKFILQEIRSLRESVTMQPWMRDSDRALQFNMVWVPGHYSGSDKNRVQAYVNRLGYTPQDVSELPEEEYERVEARLKSMEMRKTPEYIKRHEPKRKKKSKQAKSMEDLAALAAALEDAKKDKEESGEEDVEAIDFAAL